MGRVKVTGGALRGRQIRVPEGSRPSSSRVREALFSIWGERIAGCRFLDLFAGSGAVGIEALSRGAELAVLVEGSGRRFRGLAANLSDLDLRRCEARRLDLPRELTKLSSEYRESFDLIFADPPYAFSALERLLDGCEELLAQGGELAIEHSRRVSTPAESGGLARVDQRSYGESSMSFYRWHAIPGAEGASC